MGKQHQTIPNEPEEMPDKKQSPEIYQPHDPREPTAPQEDPDNIPIELPPDETPGGDDGPVVSG